MASKHSRNVCVCVRACMWRACVRVYARMCVCKEFSFLPDIERFQLFVVLVQGNDLEETIVQTKPDAAALRVNDAQNPCLRGATNPILSNMWT